MREKIHCPNCHAEKICDMKRAKRMNGLTLFVVGSVFFQVANRWGGVATIWLLAAAILVLIVGVVIIVRAVYSKAPRYKCLSCKTHF